MNFYTPLCSKIRLSGIKTLFLFLISFITVSSLFGQESLEIKGQVFDINRVPLVGATVYTLKPFKGEITDEEGNFVLTGLESGAYQVVTSLLGFKKDTIELELNENEDLLVVLEQEVFSFSDIEIKADRVIERTSVSNISFSKAPLESSQGLLEDPLRTLSTLPGIGHNGDLFSPSQLFVRGGAPDENLFLLDNNKVYFPYYFGGQKSIFNTETVEELELITGGFNAAYGNHMSSVMNVQTRDGDDERYKGNVSLGFYNSSALIEGPIIKEKASLLIAVRRTYLDLFLGEDAAFPVPSFGDVTYKFSSQLAPSHKLSFSGISSTESMDFNTFDPEPGLPNKLETGATNHFQSLQIKSTAGSKFYNKLSLTHGLNRNSSEIGSNLKLNIHARQLGLRNDATFYISNEQKIKAGIQYDYGFYEFTGNAPLDPLETDPNDTTLLIRDFDIDRNGESLKGAYVLYDALIKGRFGVNAGFRVDHNRSNKYADFSPRVALNYLIDERSKVRFSTGIFNQFPGAEGGNALRSQRALHYILGYEYRLNKGLYGWIEGYIKDYQNLVIFDENLAYSNEGYGLARGVEVLIRKESGPLRGWLSYAYSKSERLIPLSQEVTDFEFDQRFIFNAVAEYHISRSEKYSFIPVLAQINFRYTDGTPYTPVLSAEQINGRWVKEHGATLSARNTDYVNLNARVEWRLKFGKNISLTSFVEGWNLLDARNILGRTYQYSEDFPNNFQEQAYYANPRLIAGGFKLSFGGG
jgi:hypothetical protein